MGAMYETLVPRKLQKKQVLSFAIKSKKTKHFSRNCQPSDDAWVKCSCNFYKPRSRQDTGLREKQSR